MNAPRFLRNQLVHKDLKVLPIKNIIKLFAVNFQKSPGALYYNLDTRLPGIQRLKRKRPYDLVR